MTFPLSLSVVIMAFNEEQNLPVVARAAAAWLDVAVARWELLLVDDGSTDGTGAVADALAAERPGRIRALHHGTNRGMGAAIRTGYGAATLDWVTLLPADGQIEPAMLGRFLPATARCDLVFSRYDQRDDPAVRLLLSRGFYTLVRAGLGMRIDTTGVMMIRRSLLEGLPLESSTFFVNFEIPWKLLRRGVTHETVIISCRPRLSGRSKVAGARRLSKVLYEMARLRLRGDAGSRQPSAGRPPASPPR